MTDIQNGNKVKYKAYVEDLDGWITYRVDMITLTVEVLDINMWVESHLSYGDVMAKINSGELFPC